AHHAGLAPEGNREHSIGHQVSALNVGFMEHLQITEGFAQGILRRYLWVRFSPNLQNLGIRLCSRLPTLHMPFVAKSCSKRAAKSGPQNLNA
ncbi:hypothetical protein, partial [Pseudomonas hunanensis]|uniref:hypothetical protein n=1 Tax=Pseudomonas hunanensis TaxID=1247546 RepID=UPI00380CFCE1